MSEEQQDDDCLECYSMHEITCGRITKCRPHRDGVERKSKEEERMNKLRLRGRRGGAFHVGNASPSEKSKLFAGITRRA